MYNIDPTLYGATLPQRDIHASYNFPHVGANLPMQPFPFTGAPKFFSQFPQYQYPQFQQQLNIPYGYGLPPIYAQGHGYTPQVMTPYMQGGFPWTQWFPACQLSSVHGAGDG